MTIVGRTCVVTGAGRGLGRAIALALAREGGNVALLARTADELAATAAAINGMGRRAEALPTDVADFAAVERSIAVAEARLGPIEVLVNNAGTQGPIGPVAYADPDEWARNVAVNLIGPFHLLRTVLPGMITRRSGAIVNISGGGATAARPRFGAYAATKAALVRLTETVAAEVAGAGIRVNAVAPGALPTSMRDEILAAGEHAGTVDDPEALERAASLVVFLASEESRGLTGKLVSAPHDPWREWAGRGEELSRTSLYTLGRLDPRTVLPLIEELR